MSASFESVASFHAVDSPAENIAIEAGRRIREKGRAFLMVSGTSMMPWIRPGDVVFVRRAEIGQIKRGDVVLFELRGKLCIHRAISVQQVEWPDAGCLRSGLLTKGDAVTCLDEIIAAENLLGKIAFLRRNGRELNLESGTMRLLGRCLAAMSIFSAAWLPLARWVHRRIAQLGGISAAG